MPKNWSQCIQAAKKAALAQEEPNYNYKNLNLSTYNHNNQRRYSGKALYKAINEDSIFKIALQWGMSGGLLFNLCQDKGLECVKASILFVNQLPEPKRNGKYCRVVILNGGPSTSKVPLKEHQA